MAVKNKERIRRLVLSGLLAALTTVATLLIRIPTPSKGYINLGDCFVNISGWILGPAYGAGAAGVGSALADLIAGYSVYAPATFVIKALMAAASFYVFTLVMKSGHSFAARIIAAAGAELIMCGGYFLFEAVLYGRGTALAGVPANIVQGIGGAVISVVLYELIFRRIPVPRFGSK